MAKKTGKLNLLKVVILVVAALAVLSAGFLAYMGAFGSVKVAEKNIGPYTYVYEAFVGPYENTSPLFRKVNANLMKEGVKTQKGIGIYYDNPMTVPAAQLRSDCGYILDEKDYAALPKLLEKYQARTLGAKTRLVVEFPYRNSLSFILGPMKVYPVLMKSAVKSGRNISFVFEIYDMRAGKIVYGVETN